MDTIRLCLDQVTQSAYMNKKLNTDNDIKIIYPEKSANFKDLITSWKKKHKKRDMLFIYNLDTEQWE